MRKNALTPNTAYRNMKVWESELFSKLPESEAAELRRSKMVIFLSFFFFFFFSFFLKKNQFFSLSLFVGYDLQFVIEKSDVDAAKEHIEAHWAVIKAREKKRQEEEKKRAVGRGMGGVLGELKQRSEEQRQKEIAEAAAKLPQMEEEIDFSDDEN